MIRPEHLAYFKNLFEGRAEISWKAWFPQNEAQLTQDLPRVDFLRLKFYNLDEAEKLLKQAGVEYIPSPLAIRRERYYAQLHQSVLDEKGRPKEAFLRKAYGGAVGAFMDKNFEKGKKALKRELGKIMRRHPLVRSEDLGDFYFSGEMEFELGNRDLGQAIIELVAAVQTDDDLLFFAIDRARELLGQGPRQ
jgi:hypothetical protein